MATNERTERQLALHRCVLRYAGFPVEAGMRVLDFGCGEGEMVDSLAAEGVDAWGCDVVESRPRERLRLIDLDSYRVPFDDASFDIVISDQVFEHVQDPGLAFSEIARVLKPGGGSLHVFPSRWKLVEVHVKVPLAGVVRARPWLALWSRLGVRNEFQSDMDAAAVADVNHRFLTRETHYMRRSEMFDRARTYFGEVRLMGDSAIRCAPGRVARLAPLAPVLGPVYSGLRMRALLLARPLTATR